MSSRLTSSMHMEYPVLEPRRYGVILHNKHNSPFIAPDAFVLARFFGTAPSKLEKILARWKPGTDPGFAFDRPYRVELADGSSALRTLDSLQTEDLVNAAQKRLRSTVGERFWQTGSDMLLKAEERQPYAGNVVIGGKISSKRGPGSHTVSIEGPFRSSRRRFDRISCDCEEAVQAQNRGAYPPRLELVDDHAAALLMIAAYHPDRVANLERINAHRRTKIWLPFDPLTPQDPSRTRDQLTHLMVSAALGYAFSGMGRYGVAQELADVPALYDPELKRLISAGQAHYGVILNKFPFGADKDFKSPVQQWYRDIEQRLQRDGFTRKGFVLEFAGSPQESVGIEFVRGYERRRLAFPRDSLPVMTYRQIVSRSSNLFLTRESINQHPLDLVGATLGQDHPWAYDDATRRITTLELRDATNL